MLKHLKYAYHLVHGKVREALKNVTRSPKWGGVRKAFLKDHPGCAACGATKHLNVHHVEPFHLHPELELDPKNLITLCLTRNLCHLKIGHGDNYKAYNPNVRLDAEHVRKHPESRDAIEKAAKERRLMA